MYIEIELENGTTLEFWEVRSWNYSQTCLWIYFIEPILQNEIAVGFLENAKVTNSFIYEGKQENSPENLKLLL